MLQQLEDTEKAWRAATAANSAAVGNLQLHVLDNAGHWLQADNPDGLHAMMLPWIRDMHQNRLVH
jgi:pimeloyl-ACP methyl ester carboxylesterase